MARTVNAITKDSRQTLAPLRVVALRSLRLLHSRRKFSSFSGPAASLRHTADDPSALWLKRTSNAPHPLERCFVANRVYKRHSCRCMATGDDRIHNQYVTWSFDFVLCGSNDKHLTYDVLVPADVCTPNILFYMA